MDIFVAIGVAAVIEALNDKKALARVLPKLAKVYVAIERAAESSPNLASAIERARMKS